MTSRINIGVVAKTKMKAVEKLRDICCELDESIVKHFTKDRIVLKNGGNIIALGLSQNVRGYSFNELYVSRELRDDELFMQCILSNLRPRQFFDGNKLRYVDELEDWDWRYHVRYF